MQAPLREREPRGQVVHDRRFQAVDHVEDGAVEVQAREAVLRAREPCPALHTDVVHADHREEVGQRLPRAEQEQPRDGEPGYAAAVLLHHAERAEELRVVVVQLGSAGVAFASCAAVVGERGLGGVGLRRAVEHPPVEGPRGLGLEEPRDVVLVAPLVRRPHTEVGALRQPTALDVDGLSVGVCLGDVGRDEHAPVHHLALDLGAHAFAEHRGALRGKVGGDLVRVGDALGNVLRLDVALVARDAEQEVAAAQARCVRERRDGLHHGLPDLGRPLGLDAAALVGLVELAQEVARRHAPSTSISIPSVSASSAMISRVISSTLRSRSYV